MSGLLDSPHLDVRMAAGEVIALMMERGRQYDDDYEWEAGEQLIDKLRQLATDSHKYRAKKDRKTQRSSFRDILRYVESDLDACPAARVGSFPTQYFLNRKDLLLLAVLTAELLELSLPHLL
ncbi:Interferon- developmental regulator 1 [Homalodisca vitripennis]|nr:Interferon- developmental regulator 1 [Homalodisca vitripennis]